jgi:hypothetical protein
MLLDFRKSNDAMCALIFSASVGSADFVVCAQEWRGAIAFETPRLSAFH